MKKNFILLAFLFATVTNAQVGIGTDNPKVTLDVLGKPELPSSIDGLLIPRLTGDELRAKNSIYTNAEHSTLIFVTIADTNPAGKTIQVTEPGYYYYNQPESSSNGLWVRFTNDNHWKVQNTSNSATSNTDNIYQKGKVAIGFDDTTPVSNAQLEVKGTVLAKDTNTTTGHIASLGVANGSTQLTSQEFENAFQGKYSSFSSNIFSNSLGTFQGNGTNGFLRQSDVSQGLITQVNQNNNQYSFAQLHTNDSASKESNLIKLTSNEKNLSELLPGGIKITSAISGSSEKGIYIRHDQGVRFVNDRRINTSGNTVSVIGSSYVFPTNNGSANQVLTTDGNSQDATLVWKNISDIYSPSSPRYFYFPTLSLPISTSNANRVGISYNQVDGTYQVDLFEILRNQMANPVASSNASSDYLSELVLQRDKYEYFVIEANQQIFKNISFLRGNGNEGKLVYKVNSVENSPNSETMNIIIKLKQ